MSEPTAAEMQPLSNRIKKRDRHLARQAKRERTDAYRVYDRDIPEFPLVVERYGDAAVMAVRPNRRLDALPEDEQDAWAAAAAAAVADGLGIDSGRVFFKRRVRQKAKAQYEKLGHDSAERIVAEGDLRFLVNLSDYLDTGLFLDHRTTRGWLQKNCRDLRVLNLFAYTGSLSVAALKGGAAKVVSLDMSNTYLDWAEKNVRLNGLDERRHRAVREDVLAWLKLADPERWDLIICDPPSFSNSKRMDGTLDIQRDHAWLVRQCLKRLDGDGRVWFSTNRRGFKLDDGALGRAAVDDLTEASTPFDFARAAAHRLFEIRPR